MLASLAVLLALVAAPEPGAQAVAVGTVVRRLLDPLRDSYPEVRVAAARAIDVTVRAELLRATVGVPTTTTVTVGFRIS